MDEPQQALALELLAGEIRPADAPDRAIPAAAAASGDGLVYGVEADRVLAENPGAGWGGLVGRVGDPVPCRIGGLTLSAADLVARVIADAWPQRPALALQAEGWSDRRRRILTTALVDAGFPEPTWGAESASPASPPTQDPAPTAVAESGTDDSTHAHVDAAGAGLATAGAGNLAATSSPASLDLTQPLPALSETRPQPSLADNTWGPAEQGSSQHERRTLLTLGAASSLAAVLRRDADEWTTEASAPVPFGAEDISDATFEVASQQLQQQIGRTLNSTEAGQLAAVCQEAPANLPSASRAEFTVPNLPSVVITRDSVCAALRPVLTTALAGIPAALAVAGPLPERIDVEGLGAELPVVDEVAHEAFAPGGPALPTAANSETLSDGETQPTTDADLPADEAGDGAADRPGASAGMGAGALGAAAVGAGALAAGSPGASSDAADSVAASGEAATAADTLPADVDPLDQTFMTAAPPTGQADLDDSEWAPRPDDAASEEPDDTRATTALPPSAALGAPLAAAGVGGLAASAQAPGETPAPASGRGDGSGVPLAAAGAGASASENEASARQRSNKRRLALAGAGLALLLTAGTIAVVNTLMPASQGVSQAPALPAETPSLSLTASPTASPTTPSTVTPTTVAPTQAPTTPAAAPLPPVTPDASQTQSSSISSSTNSQTTGSESTSSQTTSSSDGSTSSGTENEDASGPESTDSAPESSDTDTDTETTNRPGTSTSKPGTNTSKPGTTTSRPGTSTSKPGTTTSTSQPPSTTEPTSDPTTEPSPSETTTEPDPGGETPNEPGTGTETSANPEPGTQDSAATEADSPGNGVGSGRGNSPQPASKTTA